MTDIVLFGFPTSPYTLKVAGYLHYKRLNYRFVGVNPINYRETAFTKTRQVPILQIANEWRSDSDDIALWLDEMFPQTPLIPELEYDKTEIFEANSWINKTVIPAMFRLSVDWPSISTGLLNGWKLGKAVHQSAEIPMWCRVLWPLLVRKAGFVNRIVQTLNRNEPLHILQKRVVDEFSSRLDDGLYLGGQSQPSLADVSLYPLVIFGHQLELRSDIPWLENATVKAWVNRMEPHFDNTPSLRH